MKLLFYFASVTLAFSASSVAAELTAEVPKGRSRVHRKSDVRCPSGYREGCHNHSDR